MDNQFVANFIEIDGGQLRECTVNRDVSVFQFESGLIVNSFSSWIITKAFGFGGKESLIGARDILNESDQFTSVAKILMNYKLKVLVLNRGGLFQLQFLNEISDRISIDILSDSVNELNWEVVAIDGTINNLNTSLEKFEFA